MQTAALDDASSLPEIPGFESLEYIGEGGMGQVILARRGVSQETVAIKLSRTSVCAERFHRENELGSSLSHPNLVAVLDTGSVDGRDYQVMEYVAGGPIRSLIESSEPVSIPLVRSVVDDVASALDYLHQNGVIHRDVKPDNILLTTNGNVKLADMGVSVPVDEVGQLTQTGSTLGTWDYMAPEQRTRLPTDTRADQYSLAVVAYELLTKRRPFGRFKPPSTFNRNVNKLLDEVLARGLAQEAEDRFMSVDDFNVAFQAAIEKCGPANRRIATYCVVAGVFTLVFIAIYQTWRTNNPARAGEVNNASARQELPISTSDSPRDADEVLIEAVESIEPNVEELRLRADELMRKLHRSDLAVACYNEAIRIAPADAGLLVERAEIYFQMERRDLAQSDLQAAIEMDDAQPDARANLGFCYMESGELEDALKVLDQHIAMYPDHARAHAFRGWVKAKLGHHPIEAVKDLNLAVKLDPKCRFAYHYRALLNTKFRNYEHAQRDYLSAIDAAPDNPFGYAYLAEFLARCPDKNYQSSKEAIRIANKGCQLTSHKSWQNLRALGLALEADGQSEKAIETYQEALTYTQPNNRRKVLNHLLPLQSIKFESPN